MFGFTCAIQCFDDGDLFFMLMQRDKIGQTLGVVFFLGVTCEIHWFDGGLKHKTKTPIQSKPVVFFLWFDQTFQRMQTENESFSSCYHISFFDNVDS